MKLKSILESIGYNDIRDAINQVERRSSFMLDEYDEDEGFIYFSTREHGDVSRGKPSDVDYDEAKRVIKWLKLYLPKSKFRISNADEWVNISVQLPMEKAKNVVKKNEKPEYHYTIIRLTRDSRNSAVITRIPLYYPYKTFDELKKEVIKDFGKSAFPKSAENKVIKKRDELFVGGTTEISIIPPGKVSKEIFNLWIEIKRIK